MKKILVPCDFSDAAINAFRFAVDIASISNGEIILLNIIETPIMQDTMLMPTLYFEQEIMDELKASAEKSFKALKSKWIKNNEVKATLVTEYGGVNVAIEAQAKKRKVDLIVMGTTGATGAKEFFVGSNTEKTVRRSNVPVIAVKKYVKAGSIRNIVFPNMLGQDQESLVMKVKSLQAFFNAQLHIVYINTPVLFRSDFKTRKELKAFAKRFMLKDYTVNIYNDLDLQQGIIHFASEIEADMVAMSTHGRRGLNHFITSSIAEDVVNHIDYPIWTSVEK